jgi:hypothetical protein
MHTDSRRLQVTAVSAEAVRAFDRAIDGYLSYRADIPARLAAVFAVDPDFGLAHVLKGYFAMLAYKAAALPLARTALSDAWLGGGLAAQLVGCQQSATSSVVASGDVSPGSRRRCAGFAAIRHRLP